MIGTLVLNILRQKNIKKFSSAELSIRNKGLFCVSHKSKISIDKNVKVNIKDGFFFNMPWSGRQNQPA